MIYPRQKLYDINFKSFFKCFILGDLNKLKKKETEKEIIKKLRRSFFKAFGFNNILPLSMGRVAFYLAIKNSIKKNKTKILLCPFTIFDMINMIHLAGGKPDFVDSNINTPHMNYNDLKLKLTKDVAAIVITHYHNFNPNLREIYLLCKRRGIKIIEDYAISLGSKRNLPVPDFAIFSFGLFKFISSLYGGALFIKSEKLRKKIQYDVNKWPKMSTSDLLPVYIKGIKFLIFTKFFIFKVFTFPIFKIGYLKNINFIKKMSVNDPNPFYRKKLSNLMKKKLSIFQLKEIIRQIPNAKKNRIQRLKTAKIYFKNIKNNNVIKPKKIDKIKDCYLNYPIIVKDKKFYDKLMKNNYDASKYFYRNCSNLKIFRKFYTKKLINLQNFVDRSIILPNYSGLSSKYVKRFTKFINSNS
tara:strand:- start:862 stop:2097 length:1236 start_codon:yes stop_codon:yes gene_type:complete